MSKFKSDLRQFLIEQPFYSLNEFHDLSKARRVLQYNMKPYLSFGVPSRDTVDGSSTSLANLMAYQIPSKYLKYK